MRLRRERTSTKPRPCSRGQICEQTATRHQQRLGPGPADRLAEKVIRRQFTSTLQKTTTIGPKSKMRTLMDRNLFCLTINQGIQRKSEKAEIAQSAPYSFHRSQTKADGLMTRYSARHVSIASSQPASQPAGQRSSLLRTSPVQPQPAQPVTGEAPKTLEGGLPATVQPCSLACLHLLPGLGTRRSIEDLALESGPERCSCCHRAEPAYSSVPPEVNALVYCDPTYVRVDEDPQVPLIKLPFES